MEVKIHVFKCGKTPTKATFGSAGFDIYCPDDVLIPAMSTTKIELNFRMECPSGHFALLKDRSSLASRGLTVVGGVIDGDYRGEVVVCIRNENPSIISIAKGDRICQMIFLPIMDIVMVSSKNLSSTQRGSKGFGSTGA